MMLVVIKTIMMVWRIKERNLRFDNWHATIADDDDEQTDELNDVDDDDDDADELSSGQGRHATIWLMLLR